MQKHIFETQQLINHYPPRWQHPHKKLVYQIACPPGCQHSGQLIFSRWPPRSLPKNLPTDGNFCALDSYHGFFAYEPSLDERVTEWYLNFAHYDLFSAYGTSLFAQDEMQVAEHPALAALREALVALNITPLTVEDNKPTPILIKGVERRCQIATDPNPNELRPHGLYGNHFALASAQAIIRATTPINPPTISHILALEAPHPGHGFYREQQISYILTTAFTGFVAAKAESEDITVIHTGFWGCGAYGGNRVLMVLLQIIAGHLAQIERLVFHAADTQGIADIEQAKHLFEKQIIPLHEVNAIIAFLTTAKFCWGISDGN
jgi:hypothetical protein